MLKIFLGSKVENYQRKRIIQTIPSAYFQFPISNLIFVTQIQKNV